METSVSQGGAETTIHPAEGDLAFMESEIVLAGAEVFQGKGTLTFGDDGEHMLRFSSAETGRMLPGGHAGTLAGAVTWRVEGGSGRFSSASGFITSLFTLTKSGEISEYQCGLIFLPG